MALPISDSPSGHQNIVAQSDRYVLRNGEEPLFERSEEVTEKEKEGAEAKCKDSKSLYLTDNELCIYHYLTFETELPAPSNFGSIQNGVPVPEAPDLRDYVSPFTWSESRKTFMTWLSCAITVVTAYTAGSYSPASQQMSEYWHVSQVAVYVGITTFTTGFAMAPMILAPFSELNGRRPVFIATGILFVICQLCCAVTRSFPGMLVARFFAGVGGSTFSTMVGGVVSDMYHTQGEIQVACHLYINAINKFVDRNKPMALFSGAALFGTGLGPLLSGFIAQRISWRWVFCKSFRTLLSLSGIVLKSRTCSKIIAHL